MEVVFDPAKDAENIRKHGISLGRTVDFDFIPALYDIDDSQDYGEVRWNAIGWLDANLHSLTFAQDAQRSAQSAFARQRDRSRKTMPKSIEPTVDAENSEWTKERLGRAKRFDELPEGLRQVLSAGKRGQQTSPTKELVSIRLSPDVLIALRARGRGWQTLVDETLREQFVKNG